jgi:uncharacterized membrane protein
VSAVSTAVSWAVLTGLEPGTLLGALNMMTALTATLGLVVDLFVLLVSSKLKPGALLVSAVSTAVSWAVLTGVEPSTLIGALHMTTALTATLGLVVNLFVY